MENMASTVNQAKRLRHVPLFMPPGPRSRKIQSRRAKIGLDKPDKDVPLNPTTAHPNQRVLLNHTMAGLEINSTVT
ncbi:hypothetical protein DVH05_027362 [Phytophthora capsici]|nr:hypothetical protein DVH05_027362 [Phytophthora capsici]